MDNKICGFCQGELRRAVFYEKKYTVDKVEYTVPNVKFLKCNNCGQEFITEEVHDYILDFIEKGVLMMDKKSLQDFLENNNLEISVRKNWEDEKEVSYTYLGYYKDTLIFDMNEFFIAKGVKVDVLNSNVLDLIELLKHTEWVYELFTGSEGTFPLADIESREFKFKKN